MSKKIRKCIVCRDEYEYCPHCNEHNPDEKWRFIYCSEGCREIDHVHDEYESGQITKAEAKARLEGLDLSKLSIFREDVKPIIEEIIKVDAFKTSSVEKAEKSEKAEKPYTKLINTLKKNGNAEGKNDSLNVD